MATPHDVAAYIVKTRAGELTALQLQKFVYYAQAWSLVCTNTPLFSGRIEAWVQGPVQPELFPHHAQKIKIVQWPKGSAQNLTYHQMLLVDSVCAEYGHLTPEQLRDLTHKEGPWIDARAGLKRREKSNKEITRQAMISFHSKQCNVGRRIQSRILDRQIADLQDEIVELSKHKNGRNDLALQKKKSLLASLRQQHAELIAESFDASRLMPPRDGFGIVERLSTFLERHENSPSTHSATPAQNRKKALA